MTEAERAKVLGVAKVTEIELMEYADGVLGMPRRQDVRDALMRHPELVRLLESYLFAGQQLRQIYEEHVPDPKPERYLGVLAKPEERKPIVKPRFRLFEFGRRGTPLRTAMMAAAATLVAVAGGGWLALRDYVPPDKQGVAAFPSLQKGLETTASFQSAELEKNVTLEPRMTFYSQRLGRWCREFSLTYGATLSQPGQIACRDNEGTWRLRHLAPTAVVDATAPNQGGIIRPATGGTARALEALDATNFLEAEKERPLIERGWQLRPDRNTN